jgi:hypothetical protein
MTKEENLNPLEAAQAMIEGNCVMSKPTLIKNIEELMSSPADWDFGLYRAVHKSGVKLWIADGVWFFGIVNPVKYLFPIFWRFYLWGKLKKLKQNCAIYKVEEWIEAKSEVTE